MFKVTEIKELIRAVDKSTIGELVIKGDNKEQITIRKQVGTIQPQVELVEQVAPVSAPPTPAVAPVKEEAPAGPDTKTGAPAPVVDDANLHKVTSPMVGTFYAAPTPDSDAYVKVGDKVSEESVVCIVEAMKLMNELEAEVKGEIVEILAENGQLVEYGQPLFLVKLS
ncbi:acetyl-CoA carboxylase biotin carboxyl carrier protein [Bacillus sp. FJAT-45350]|uniref:acetyl-CoA carboxylase biotin carboxyl carrier protein n=1 Tax=Bacillus sp. FJAT-45350 TaxID=2011014 RepID=UPI000BB82C54|nr:acetyl-CoA carboxylase biotin carboxyl carrier protein [Bacillus sp. FJAT-45350]